MTGKVVHTRRLMVRDQRSGHFSQLRGGDEEPQTILRADRASSLREEVKSRYIFVQVV